MNSKQHAPNLRAQVIRLLLQVQQGQSLAQLQAAAFDHVAAQDKALFHELSLGVLRQWFVLKHMALPLLDNPPSGTEVATALYVGLYQLFFTRIPDHAAISETVEAVKQLGAAPAAPVVNAVLRRARREQALLLAEVEHAHGLPSWLFKRLKKDWGDDALSIAHTLRQAAPIFLRINPQKVAVADYLTALHHQQIAAELVTQAHVQTIKLLQAVQIGQLPGYAEGWFAVQDINAQLCAGLLPDLTDQMVLDACAAPGGKTAHMLTQYQPKHLIALDIDQQRLQRVSENLERLQLNSSRVQLVTGDASTWQTEQPLDVIVLDAPCSASGVIRRHPDIRILRQSGDIAATVAVQAAIVEHLWGLLPSGGYLMYITCSILKAENEQQMQHFFAQHADAREQPLHIEGAIAQRYGQQLLPTAGGGDGFYYCLIQKV